MITSSVQSDRELVELAAKAAGYGGFWDGAWKEYILPSNKSGEGKFWRPLHDDGDALRLAVRLEIWVHPDLKTVEAIGVKAVYEGNFSDPYIATRRAIVRAAAAIAPKEPS